MRNVLVHYHLFKNAGSSIDRCLKDSFGDSWHAFDPERSSALYTAKEFDEIILENEKSIAFSSHCIVPPISNRVAKLHPIIVFREPISRVMSAYLFEWKIQKNLEEAYGRLDEYIHKKFSKPRMNAIENFQTIRLAVDDDSCRRPSRKLSDSQLLEGACNLVEQLPAFGLVERFEESVGWIQNKYEKQFPQLNLKPVTANVTQTKIMSMDQRHKAILDLVGQELFDELTLRNQLDIQLYQYALGRFEALSNGRSVCR